MVRVSEADHLAIREIHGRDGMIAAALELQCLYPEIENQSVAIEFVRSLVIWTPLPGRSWPG